MLFELDIASAKKEEGVRGGAQKGITLPLFGVSSAFIRAFARLPRQGRRPEDVYRALGEFTAQLIPGLTGREWFEEACMLHVVQMMKEEGSADREWFHDWFWFSLEAMALEFAFTEWLTPQKHDQRYLKPSQRYMTPLNPNLVQGGGSGDQLELLLAWYMCVLGFGGESPSKAEAARDFLAGYACYAFFSRSREVSAILSLNPDVNPEDLPGLCLGGRQIASSELLGFWYHGPTLLSLAWVEVAWALMNDKYAHKCDVCGGVFALERPYSRKAYLCSKECAQAWRAQKMGGEDALRAYNREAQRRHRAKERQKVK